MKTQEALEFAARLRGRRRSMKFAMDELARIVNISLAGMNRLELGYAMPSAVCAAKLAQALRCDLNWLLLGVGEEEAPPDEKELRALDRLAETIAWMQAADAIKKARGAK